VLSQVQRLIKILENYVTVIKYFNKVYYHIQLIEQPILQILNVNFPNLRCCKVFLFFQRSVILAFFDVCILALI
jgi:hypothetical protein